MMTGVFRLDGVIAGGAGVMKLALGNEAVFVGVPGGSTQISAAVISCNNVTISGGMLQLKANGGGTFPSFVNLEVQSGSLRISTDQSVHDLNLLSEANLIIDEGVSLTITGTFRHGGGNIIRQGKGQLMYGPASMLVYAGTTAQAVSATEWPLANGPKDVVMMNSSGVLLTANRSIAGAVIVDGLLATSTYQLATGSLTVNSGGVIKVGAVDAAGALAGAFGSSAAVVLNAGSTVEYNGTAKQYIASGTYANLVVNNGSNDLVLTGNVTIGGTLTMEAGTQLDLSGKALTLRGSVAGPLLLKGSSTSVLNINGTGQVGTVNFDQSTDGATNALATLSVSSGSATLGGKLNLYKALNVSGGSLEVAGKNLVLKSCESQTAYVAPVTGTLTGETNVTVERFVPAWSSRRYRLLTAPVLNTTINASWQEGGRWNGSTSLPATGYGTLITGQQQGSAATANTNGFDFWAAIYNSSGSVRTYVPAASSSEGVWQPVASTLNPDAFDSHQAYLLFVRGDRALSTGTAAGSTTLRATGTLKTGNFAIAVPATFSHTLVGNPYACPLDFKAIYEANTSVIKPSFCIWQASLGNGTGGYAVVQPADASSNLYEVIPGDGTSSAENRLIHSGEGFFVMPNSTAGSPNTLTIQESHKATGTPSVSVFRQMGGVPAKLYANLYAKLTSNVLVDGVLYEYDAAYANGNGFTVYKAVNTGENMSILKSGNDLIVASDAMPHNGDTVQLRLWNTAIRDYQLDVRSLNFVGSGLSAVLVDRYRNTETSLNLNDATTSHSFSITSDDASKDPLRFYIVYRSNNNITLPVAFVAMKAEETNNGNVSVQWKVASEGGTKSYSVQRALDGKTFTNIAGVSAKGGTGEQAYGYADSRPAPVNFYRIKAVAVNGEARYSQVVKVQLQTSGEAISIYPNPVSGEQFNLQFTNKPRGLYTVSMYNLAGQVVMRKRISHENGNSTESITPGGQLPAGLYRLEVQNTSGQKQVLNLMVQKD